MKKILYLDMDGVIADFDHAIHALCPELGKKYISDNKLRSKKVEEICLLNTDFFETIPPLEGAIEAVCKLFELYEVYFLSTPMWNVPLSFTGKRLWLETHFGSKAEKRLILTHRKDLNLGDFLIDDRLKNGVENFTGIHIHFGTPQFPDWKTTLHFLEHNQG